MAKYILVASPDTAFGDTLCIGLSDAGGFTVQLAASGADVLASIGNLAFDAAILDSLISDFPLPSLVDALRLKLPDIKVLVIPPTDPLSALTLEDCGADAFINKPVFIPDLLDTIRGLIKWNANFSSQHMGSPFEEEPPRDMRDILGEETAKVNWGSNPLPAEEPPDTLVLPLEDVIEDTQEQITVKTEGPKKNTGALQEIPPEQFREMEELARWFSESTARSAILVSKGQVVATSGEIAPEAEKRYAPEVTERFRASDARELIRYIPPQQGNGNELLFAASLGEEKYLILTYDALTPYAMIRLQANLLRKRLKESDQPASIQPEEITGAWSAQESAPQPDEAKLPVLEEMEEAPIPEVGTPEAAEVEREDEPADEIFGKSSEGELPVPFWEKPDQELAEKGTAPGASLDIDRDFPLFGHDAEKDEEEYPWLAAGAIPIAAGVAREETDSSVFPWEEEPASSTGADFKSPNAVLTETSSPGGRQAEASPEGGDGGSRVFLMVPADSRVFLTGKLGGELGGWIPQICQSMGWEVSALAVRPEFVRVGLIAPSGLKDDVIVGTLQDATARLVASNYPQMALDAETPLFWADDFLKLNPSDPLEQTELNAFIRHLRR